MDNAYVLLWDFADLIHPMLKLESPHEIFCFRFNPSIPGVSSNTNTGRCSLFGSPAVIARNESAQPGYDEPLGETNL